MIVIGADARMSGGGSVMLVGGCTTEVEVGGGLGISTGAGIKGMIDGGGGAGRGSDKGVLASIAEGASGRKDSRGEAVVSSGGEEVASVDSDVVVSAFGGSGSKSTFDCPHWGHTYHLHMSSSFRTDII